MATLYYFNLGALLDFRLLIGITKSDSVYEEGPDSVSKEDLKEKLFQSIKSCIGTEISRETVIPICGKWFLNDRKLIGWLLSHTEKDEKPPDIVKATKKALKRYRLQLPSGQDQTMKQAIRKHDPEMLVKQLEEASGMSSIKSRFVYSLTLRHLCKDYDL